MTTTEPWVSGPSGFDLATATALLAHAPVGFAFFDPSLRYLHVNAWLADANGLTIEEHLGKTPRQVVPMIAESLEPRLRAVLDSGEPLVNFELSGGLPRDTSDRRHWIVSCYPVFNGDDGVVGVGSVVIDVTERRRALEVARLRNRQQEAVADLGQRALEGLTVDQLLDEAVAVLAATLDTNYSEVLELLPNGLQLRMRAGVGWRPGMVGEAIISAGPDSQAGYVLNADKPVIVEDLDHEARFSGLDLLREHGVRSGLSVLIETSEGPYGVLAAHATTPRSFSDEDVAFLQAMANIVGAGVERSRADAALRTSNERLRLALEAGHMGTWELEVASGALRWSALQEAIFGLKPGEFQGTLDHFAALLHPEDHEQVMAALQGSLAEASGIDVQHRIVQPGGSVRWVHGKGGPIRGPNGEVVRLVGLTMDITDQMVAEEERTELLMREREARTHAEAAGVRLRFLAEATAALVSSLDYGRTLQHVARLAVPGFADYCSVALHDLGQHRTVAVAARRRELEQSLWQMAKDFPIPPGSPAWRIFERGAAQCWPELQAEDLRAFAIDDVHWERLVSLRPASLVIAPLVARGRSIGLLTFAVGGARRFDEEALRIAEDLAHRAALAIDNARLFRERTDSERRFRRLAGTLQQSLLPPHLPVIQGLELAAAFRPTAKGIEVGGDFYDVFPLRGKEWGVVIGDVCGKGPEAATVTALARYTLRTAAMQKRRPSSAVRTLNDAMLRDSGPEGGRFITLAYGMVRPGPDSVRLLLTVGGHPLPYVLRASGRVQAVGEPGMVIGAFPEPTLSDVEVTLSPGDTLLFYTDGVIEARGPQGVYGEHRLEEALAGALTLHPEEIVQRIEEDVLVFSRGGVRDDLAMLAMRVNEKYEAGR